MPGFTVYNRVMTTRTKTCAYCGGEFAHEVRSGTQPRYCSPEHRDKARYERARTAHATASERRCSRCKAVKPTAEFAGAMAAYCKPCMAAYAREQRAANPDPLRSRRDSLARYGLTFEEFDRRLAAQGGKCAICRTTEPGGTGRDGPRGWHIDHDHACCPTRKRSCGKCFRGILCSNCNLGIGNFQDSPELIQAALGYLLAYQARRDAEGHTSSV